MKLRGAICRAPAPERSFEKSNADASLIAQIIVEKYVDHLPLYRQIKRYERLGVTLSDSTIDSWLITAATLIMPLYQAHKDLVLKSGYIHADETTIRVQDSSKKAYLNGSSGRGATHQGYYWVYQSHEKSWFSLTTGRVVQEKALRVFLKTIRDIYRQTPA
ncbi:MAG: transposase [Sphingobacteriales bacterium]|nr:transposase [Sphingobacteriales bacterium]